MIDRVVGNYRIVEKVGEGGMGAVYRAIDLMLDREVAIKAIRPELSREAEIVERFRTEAKIAARVSHPAIATIYSFFVEDDELFLAMEFVHGKSLSQLLQAAGPLPWEQAVALLDTALDGIEQAHCAGIVHRDLKPDNLLITAAGRIKVMDFGIARAVGSGRLTRTGLLIGTLRYMAPEQIRGEEVDRRTDIYALGTVLYETLTGRVPFDGVSDYAVLKAQVEENPTPPSSAVPGLPARLDQAILRALAKDPSDRFQTVDEMRRFLSGQGSAAPQPVSTAPVFASPGTVWSKAIADQPTLVTTPTPVPSRSTARPAAATPGVPAAPPSAHAAAATGGQKSTSTSYREIQLRPDKPPGGQKSSGRRLAPWVAAAFAAAVAAAVLVPYLRRQPAAAQPSVAAAAQTAAATQAGGQPAAGPAGAVGGDAAAAAAGGAVDAQQAAMAGASLPVSGGTATLPGGSPAGAGADGAAGRTRRRAAAGGRQQASDAAAGSPGDAAAGAGAAIPDMGGPGASGGSSGTAGVGGGDAAEQQATAPAPSSPEETAAHLKRLGNEICHEIGDVRALYAKALATKERRGLQRTPSDDQLQEVLKSFHGAADHFRDQFGVGFFARTRARFGRLSHGEDEMEQRKRLAQELLANDSAVNTIMGTAQPEPGVKTLWHRIHHLCRQVAEICGL